MHKTKNSLTRAINSLTSVQAGFCCQMSYEKMFGFQSWPVLERRLRDRGLGT